MCQMCDEYQAELKRMGILPDPAVINGGPDRVDQSASTVVPKPKSHPFSPQSTPELGSRSQVESA